MKFTLSLRNAGFTLVELMIAMLLGLFLIGGIISVFLSNREIYRQNENLSRMQENARYAFDVMGRDLREAGGVVCGSNLVVTNVINDAEDNWWSDWGDGIHGYEDDQDLPAKDTGTDVAERFAGTDALAVLSGSGSNTATITAHAPPAISVNAHDFVVGDIVMACDYNKAALLQLTDADTGSLTHADDSGTPGNDSDVALTAFQAGGSVAKLSSSAWYIGNNGRGGRSLYRIQLTTKSDGDAEQGDAEEIAEGITNMQIQYLAKDAAGTLATNYLDADDASIDWTRVVAVRITFTLQSLENVGTGTQPLTRTWNMVVSLRNRQL